MTNITRKKIHLQKLFNSSDALNSGTDKKKNLICEKSKKKKNVMGSNKNILKVPKQTLSFRENKVKVQHLK